MGFLVAAGRVWIIVAASPSRCLVVVLKQVIDFILKVFVFEKSCCPLTACKNAAHAIHCRTHDAFVFLQSPQVVEGTLFFFRQGAGPVNQCWRRQHCKRIFISARLRFLRGGNDWRDSSAGAVGEV